MPDMEKVIKAVEEAFDLVHSDFIGTDDFNEKEWEQNKADALAMLKEQERKKGSWDYGTQCSVCKGTIIPPKDRKVRINFCPWCGADMRDSYE